MEEENIETPKRSFLARAVKWLVILLLVSGGFGYLGFKYSLFSVDEIKKLLGEVNIAESKQAAPEKPVAAPVSNDMVVKETGVVAEVPAEKPVVEAPAAAVNNEEIAELKENQKYFALYLSARDLRDAKNNPEKLVNELRHFTVIAGDNPEIAGKIDTLSRTVEGVTTIPQLRRDLGVLVQNIEKENAKGIWASIKYSIGNLVRVTKIKDESEAELPREIKIRAEIMLADGDLNSAIREVRKMGPKADEWVREANNLARVYEYTDFFVDYAKNKVKF